MIILMNDDTPPLHSSTTAVTTFHFAGKKSTPPLSTHEDRYDSTSVSENCDFFAENESVKKESKETMPCPPYAIAPWHNNGEGCAFDSDI